MKVINFPATRAKFDASGRTPGRFSKAKGLSSSTFSKFLRGELPYSKGRGYDQMADALREAGVLVEEDTPEPDKAA